MMAKKNTGNIHAKQGTRLASVAPVALCVAFLWPFGGGGNHTVHLMAGTATPGARGTAQMKEGDNHNTEVDVKVHALAAPDSLTPAENAYVLWIQAPGQAAQNEGQIEVNQHEDGELHTKTPLDRFQVFITAEQNAKAQAPMGPKVLSGDVSGS